MWRNVKLKGKCCICGKSMIGCLHILMGEGRSKHIWCKSPKEDENVKSLKCYVCGLSTKGSLVVIDDNGETRHVWCKEDENVLKKK